MSEIVVMKVKSPEIEKLQSYVSGAPQAFWEKFPSKELPTVAECEVNVKKLEELIYESKCKFTAAELNRAQRCVENFKNGAGSSQMDPPLGGNFSKNAKSAEKHGYYITDTVATWLKKGYIAGPFDQPPVKDFRVNSLSAIEQGEKVRPVLNVSMPKNSSLNSNIDMLNLEKVHMSNARKFGFSMCEAGQNCIMSKFDMIDAYKNVPVPVKELNLQGFQWLNKFFVETRQIFGSCSSVSNFDIFGNTILTLAIVRTNFKKIAVHRTLDDVPFVSGANSGRCEELSDMYESICNSINVKIAKECPRNEKAFKNAKQGKVLGINFDASNLTWNFPDDKKAKTVNVIKNTLTAGKLKLLEFQELMGRLNDFAQMCTFMHGFKYNLNKVLAQLYAQGDNVICLSSNARSDLKIWANVLLCPVVWLPITPRYCNPPLTYYYFTSDAAGCADNAITKTGLGCGSVGFDTKGDICFLKQLLWPDNVLDEFHDEKGCKLGNKTTMLEFLGIIIPFVIIPEKLCNKYVIVKTDSIGCFYGWLNKQASGDGMASILVRALHLISSRLCCHIHIEHLPRCSSWDSMLVDRISRSRTTTKNDLSLIDHHSSRNIPEVLQDWMINPEEDWGLATKLLEFVCQSLDDM